MAELLRVDIFSFRELIYGKFISRFAGGRA
jgi:hypothetical protein